MKVCIRQTLEVTSHCIYLLALSSSSEDSDEGTDVEIKSEESEFEEKAEMVGHFISKLAIEKLVMQCSLFCDWYN